jgi:hypothetical protein
MYTYVHKCIYKYMNVYIGIHIYMYLYIFIYVYMFIYKYANIYMYIYLYIFRENSRALFEFGQSMTVLGSCEGGFICVFICLHLYVCMH